MHSVLLLQASRGSDWQSTGEYCLFWIHFAQAQKQIACMEDAIFAISCWA